MYNFIIFVYSTKYIKIDFLNILKEYLKTIKKEMSSIQYKEALVRSFQKSPIPIKVPPEETKEVSEITALLDTLKVSNGKPCGFCKKEIHIPKYCPEFKKYKDKCTTKPGIFSHPTKRDLNGYCSAAVLVYGKYKDDIYTMMILESRDGVLSLNLPGGKREYRNEKPRQCAIREMQEELKDCPIEVFDINNYNIKPLYLWYAGGKYFIIPLEYTFKTAPIINDKFKWVNIKNLKEEHVYHLTAQVIKTFGLQNTDNVCYK
jgi:8-oxo-dGTP pyrophosphatase MutT (NUDIX family)